MKKDHITIHDVAERAGLSISTVSRALSGIQVSEKNYELVLAAADELGYVINEAARALRSDKSMTIGLVFFELTGPIGLELLSSLSSELDSKGYSVFVATAQGDALRYDKIVRRLLERRVDALLCVHGQGDGDAIKRYTQSGTPVYALISKSGGYSELPLFGPTLASAMTECTNHLIDNGHRKAVVVQYANRPFVLKQFVDIATASGLDVVVENVGSAMEDPDGLIRLCTTGPNPASVILCNQTEASTLLNRANDAGLSVPDDLSLIAIRDRSPYVIAPRKTLSLINIEPEIIGKEVARTLLEQLNGGEVAKGDIRIDTSSFIIGATSGPAPTR